MKKIILLLSLIFIFIIPFSLAQYTQFFSISLVYDKGNINQGEIKLIQSNEQLNKKSDEGEYVLKVFSFKDELLYETKFDFDLEISSAPPKEWFDDEGNQIVFPDEETEADVKLEKATIVLFVPYLSNVKNTKILKEEILKLEIDLSEFSTCNENLACDTKESFKTCPEDCPSGSMDDYCDKVADGICDTDCLPEDDVDCKEEKGKIPSEFNYGIVIVVIIVVIIIGIAGFFIYKKKKKKHVHVHHHHENHEKKD